MFSRGAQQAGRIALAVALMWLATRDVPWSDVAGTIASGKWSWFALCLVLVAIDRALMAWRWIALLRAAETSTRVPLRQLVRIFFVSTFVGTFLPGGIGGDAARVLSLTRLGTSAGVAVGSVAVDRLIGIVSVLLMSVVGIVLAGGLLDDRWLRLASVLSVAGVIVAVLLLFDSRILASLVRWAGGGRFPTVERWAQSFLAAIRQYGQHRQLLAGVLMASVAVQALRSAQAWCLGLAIGLSIGGVWYFALIPFAVLAFMLPFSIGGLGAGTASFVPLFAWAHVSDAGATALALLFWFLGVLGNLPGGLLMATSPHHQNRNQPSKT